MLDVSSKHARAETAFDNMDYQTALEAANQALANFQDLPSDDKVKNKADLTSIMELRVKIQQSLNDPAGVCAAYLDLCKSHLTHAPYFFEAAQLLRQLKRVKDAHSFCEYSCDLDSRNTRARLLLNTLTMDIKLGKDKETPCEEAQSLKVPEVEMFRVTAGVTRQNGNTNHQNGTTAPTSPTKRANAEKAKNDSPEDSQENTEPLDKDAPQKREPKQWLVKIQGAVDNFNKKIHDVVGKVPLEMLGISEQCAEMVFSNDIIAITLLWAVAWIFNVFVLGAFTVIPQLVLVSQFHKYLRKMEGRSSLNKETAYFGIPPVVFSALSLCLALWGQQL